MSETMYGENSLMQQGIGRILGILPLYLAPAGREVPVRMTGLNSLHEKPSHVTVARRRSG
jgi:hypothetical protein